MEGAQGYTALINNCMITSILIITVTTVLGAWALCRLLRSDQSSHQFPTAYQLLKSSPSIDRREMWALRAIVVLMAVFLLLLATSQF
jgi:hypothetical protein